MRVYVVRHGESESNRDKKYTGWHDAPLTDKGRSEAAQVQRLLTDVRFDRIYASDLCRAVETARTAIPGCEPETSTLLREIDVGSLTDQPYSLVTDDQKKRIAAYGYIDFGGESKETLLKRIGQFMRMLETSDCENVAVFSHGGWMLSMLDTVFGVRVPRSTICYNNCTVAVFEYTNDAWRLYSWLNL